MWSQMERGAIWEALPALVIAFPSLCPAVASHLRFPYRCLDVSSLKSYSTPPERLPWLNLCLQLHFQTLLVLDFDVS